MPTVDPRTVGRMAGVALSVTAYRNQAAGWDPRSGEGARRRGGRFNPPHSFSVLYVCLTRPCVVAELTRQARRQGLIIGDLLPRELWQLDTDLTKVLDLTEPSTLTALDINTDDLTRDDHRFTQELGDAAHQHGFNGIRTPSATGVDHVLAILPDNLARVVVSVELIDLWTTVDDLRA
jgi:RES domain-containing protein